MIEEFEPLIQQVKVVSHDPQNPVLVKDHPDNWRCIGLGNTAAVFQPRSKPGLSIKVYAPEFAWIAKEEAEIYSQLGNSPFFPRFYGRGDHSIYIEFKPGRNVYECLIQGIFIPEQVIIDVEEAIGYARSRGLNPTDINGKNVLVYEGRGCLIDVSDYRKNIECRRWAVLKQAYYNYYTKLYQPGLSVPSWVLEIIRKWYKANEGNHDLDDFASKIIKMFF